MRVLTAKGTPPLLTTGFLSCKPPQEATLHDLWGGLMIGRMTCAFGADDIAPLASGSENYDLR
jgi:hypothetical protein